MNCNINRYNFHNTFVVGGITSITGTLVLFLTENKKVNILKHFIIFFIVGCLVHILLEFFNFNNLCYDKKCYGNQCRINLR